MPVKPVYLAPSDDPAENVFLGNASTAAEAEALARSYVGVGESVYADASDVCDANGSVTDNEDDRVWIVLGLG